MSFSVLLLWCAVAIPTVLGFLRGTLFPAPCLASLPPEYVEVLGSSGRKHAEAGRRSKTGAPANGSVEGVREKTEDEKRAERDAVPIAEGVAVGAGAEAFLTEPEPAESAAR